MINCIDQLFGYTAIINSGFLYFSNGSMIFFYILNGIKVHTSQTIHTTFISDFSYIIFRPYFHFFKQKVLSQLHCSPQSSIQIHSRCCFKDRVLQLTKWTLSMDELVAVPPFIYRQINQSGICSRSRNIVSKSMTQWKKKSVIGIDCGKCINYSVV